MVVLTKCIINLSVVMWDLTVVILFVCLCSFLLKTNRYILHVLYEHFVWNIVGIVR